jgi:hypothetical protein
MDPEPHPDATVEVVGFADIEHTPATIPKWLKKRIDTRNRLISSAYRVKVKIIDAAI